MDLALNRFTPAASALFHGRRAKQTARPAAAPADPVQSIQKGAFLRLPQDTALATVTCLRGCFWITIDGQPADIVITEGQSFTTGRADLTLVFALEPSAGRLS